MHEEYFNVKKEDKNKRVDLIKKIISWNHINLENVARNDYFDFNTNIDRKTMRKQIRTEYTFRYDVIQTNIWPCINQLYYSLNI